MQDKKERNALSKIKAHLDDGRSLAELRQAGWGSWIDQLEAKGYDLRTGRLALRPPEEALEDTLQSAPNVSVASDTNAPICAYCGAERVGKRRYCVKCSTKWPEGTPPGPAETKRGLFETTSTWAKVLVFGAPLVVIVVIVMAVFDSGENDRTTGRDASSFSVLEQSEVVFEGGYSEAEIKRVLDRAMNLHGLPITESNYDRTTNVLVALRREFGVREMDILDYMIRSHVPGIDMPFHEAASIATAFLASGADY